ncbi:3-oxoacyl-[acyl-carrier-protein] synthase III C-terminal domain-containing protein [uncultured Shewanella sp.]|uniref:3-oxoacyl-ACP synthase III family protein n=1 Tax=uncultured Shewanella sp. TaxID=173975 RepID=UPI002604AD8A|nr:3-oxoacyl-[acyl-carrier-protein] synthase III C-terminal domain-containing protein [uncultured Shewanella sp.]
MDRINVDILSIGTYFPEEIRTNDWWSDNIVNVWAKNHAKTMDHIDTALYHGGLSDIETKVFSAIKVYADDPFNGAKKRYIADKSQKSSDMETMAIQNALKNAGIKAEQLDFILVQTTTPDNLFSTNAALVQTRLGASNSCFVQSTEGMCNAFLTQLQLAQGLIESEQAKYGVIVQSSMMSPYLVREDYMSSQFSDGAVAVVIGGSKTKNVLSMCHHSDGSIGNYANLGISDKHWYEDGKIQVYMNETNTSQVMQGIKLAKEMVEKSLHLAQIEKNEINFFAGHQGIAWFREVTQSHAGLEKAKSYDTYPSCTSIIGGNIPLILHDAMEAGVLKKDDLISCFTPAVGTIASSAVLRWKL